MLHKKYELVITSYNPYAFNSVISEKKSSKHTRFISKYNYILKLFNWMFVCICDYAKLVNF